jgi:hypothetical protein
MWATANESPVEIPSPTHGNLIGRSINALLSVVHQYSSVIYASLCFHFRQENYGTRLKILPFQFFILNIA